jgi:hypothetical protein
MRDWNYCFSSPLNRRTPSWSVGPDVCVINTFWC